MEHEGSEGLKKVALLKDDFDVFCSSLEHVYVAISVEIFSLKF